jgi:hypothetical protein
MGFCRVLTLIFITLKLTHYIDWSWWWVLSPTLIPLSIAAICACVYFAITTPAERALNDLKKKFGDK